MSDKISRRDFIKIAGIGSGVAAILTGCGPASRYVNRRPYASMPEYSTTGKSIYFATTCGECPAGCGLIVRTLEGRALKVEGNPDHPVSHGATCSRGQATLQGLYNPDRILAPARQSVRSSGKFAPLDWTKAIGVLKEIFVNNSLGQIGFLVGLFPDHLYDLVRLIWGQDAEENAVRYGTLSEFEGQATLVQASQTIFGVRSLPTFDIERAELIFSFGANFVETWISPVAYAYQYGMFRQGRTGERGYLVHFEPRMSQTGANADEWYPIQPGSELILAQGLGQLIQEMETGHPAWALPRVELAEVVTKSGINESDLRRLAGLFANSPRPLAIPGGTPLGHTRGLAAAQAILALNTLAENLDKPGGIFFNPGVKPDPNQTPFLFSSLASVQKLIAKIDAGEIKALFVHGCNPVYDLPLSLGFTQALKKLPTLISFGSFPDETAAMADYIFPDHTPLESWGYQKIKAGTSQATLSGLQPVVVPLTNTRSTVDLLLAAAGESKPEMSARLPFQDEVEFIQQSISGLAAQPGFFSASSQPAFWAMWQQHGGWWEDLNQTTPITWLNSPGPVDWLESTPSGFNQSEFFGDADQYPFHLLLFPSPNLGDGSAANRPVLQEIPDPMNTVMWNSWIEINPATARKLGVENDDLVKVTSPAGEVELAVYEYAGIHPEVVAIPIGQGHTALGRYAQGRGINPQDLLVLALNAAGNLAGMATRVKITPTGKKRKLARYESIQAANGAGSLFGGF